MQRAAVWISRLSHPFLVPVVTLIADLRIDGEPWARTAAWVASSIAVGIAPPALLLVTGRRRRGDRDWYVTVREQRFGLYAHGLGCLAALLAIAHFGAAPRLLRPALLAATAATAIGALLNRATKVSVHAGAAAGCAVLLAHVAPQLGSALAGCVVLVAWSRLRLGHHTPAQLLLGAGVSAACTAAALAAF